MKSVQLARETVELPELGAELFQGHEPRGLPVNPEDYQESLPCTPFLL